jgi:outer membrane protein assembly factor BamB
MKTLRIVSLSIGCLLDSAMAAEPATWPQWRGPRGDNVATEQRGPVVFGPTTNVAWQTAVPSGWSSPVVAVDRIFLTGFTPPQSLEVLCLARGDGKLLWRQAVATGKIEPFYPKLGSPATPTCATDGTRLVSYFGSSGLIAHGLDGKELWRVALPVSKLKEGFGTSSSPIIHDGLVYLLRDEDGAAKGLYAFDVATGQSRWRARRAEFRVSHSSPVIWGGCVVVVGDTRAAGYDLQTGEQRFLGRGLSAYPCASPTPGADGRLYIASFSFGSQNGDPMPAYEQAVLPLDKDKDGRLSRAEAVGTMFGDMFDNMDKDQNGFFEKEEWDTNSRWMKQGYNCVLALRPGGKGDVTDTHVAWRIGRGLSNIASPLAYQGRLYLVRDEGLLALADLESGKLLAEADKLDIKGAIWSSPFAADGKVYICGVGGAVVVLQAGEKPTVIARAQFPEMIAATPCLAGNLLLLRTATQLWAFPAP